MHPCDSSVVGAANVVGRKAKAGVMTAGALPCRLDLVLELLAFTLLRQALASSFFRCLSSFSSSLCRRCDSIVPAVNDVDLGLTAVACHTKCKAW
jgi:hypothetical protein